MTYPLNNYTSRSFGSLGATPPSITFQTQPNKSSDGREVDWNCSDWVTWHKELVKAFMNGWFASKIKYNQKDANEQANKVFRQWWDEANSWFGYNKSFCGYESLFYSYFKSVGLDDILTIPQKLLNPVTNTAVNVVNTASSITNTAADSVQNVADAAKNTSKVVSWLLPTLLIGTAVGVGTYVYKNYIKGDRKIKAAGVEI